MINNAYVALNALLAGNTTLTALLGTYKGTSTPLIKGGAIAESETDLPAIEFEVEPSTKQHFLGDYNFLLNIYTKTAVEGFIIGQTILDQFNESQTPIDGYFTNTTCNILTQVVDPTSKQVNTPMSFRIVNM